MVAHARWIACGAATKDQGVLTARLRRDQGQRHTYRDGLILDRNMDPPGPLLHRTTGGCLMIRPNSRRALYRLRQKSARQGILSRRIFRPGLDGTSPLLSRQDYQTCFQLRADAAVDAVRRPSPIRCQADRAVREPSGLQLPTRRLPIEAGEDAAGSGRCGRLPTTHYASRPLSSSWIQTLIEDSSRRHWHCG